MNNDGEKFVDFKKYCDLCKNRNLKGNEEPCDECLDHPVNLYSTKPVKFEEKLR